MRRRTRRLAPLAVPLALAAVLLGGCQDYNFSPVKYSLIQPGTERVTLSDLSTADLLFVVDDSGSMGGEQQKLAESFDAFAVALRETNIARVTANLEPIDFHVAVTTTSVFNNVATTSACAATCAGASNVCCDTVNHQPLKQARGCATLGSAAGCGAGNTCRDDCLGRAGEATCCSGPSTQPEQANVACSVVGDACGRIQNRYGTTRVPASCVGGLSCPGGTTCRTDCPGLSGANACCDAGGVGPVCDIGVGSVGGLYPAGDFVHAGSNPRVLHFGKELFCPRNGTGTACDGQFSADPVVLRSTIDTNTAPLIAQFKQNVAVGTCGSGQEQPLEAARRAIEKAVAGAQPGVNAGEWLHTKVAGGQTVPASKLVVVFVGDEDDCSTPQDPSLGVINAVESSCASDTTRRFKVADYATFFTSLGRPVAGAVIASAISNTCQDGDCNPGLCCDFACTGSSSVCTLGGLCGGQGEGIRMLDLASTMADLGADRVAGSICNPGTAQKPGFSTILERVAEVVKQPVGLQLPTVPALARLTVLRIIDASGATRKTCAGPAPVGTSGAGLDPYDWWFTSGDDTNPIPTGPSRFIFLNRPPRRCEANPGETYSADYLGQVPSGGCLSTAECAAQLGGAIESWRCCTDVDALGACLPPPPAQSAITGTCLVANGP